VDLASGKTQFDETSGEDWRIHLVDTWRAHMTGGRLKRLEDRLRSSGTFMMTYGDAVARIDIRKLLSFHRSHGGIATVTAVRPVLALELSRSTATGLWILRRSLKPRRDGLMAASSYLSLGVRLH